MIQQWDAPREFDLCTDGEQRGCRQAPGSTLVLSAREGSHAVSALCEGSHLLPLSLWRNRTAVGSERCAEPSFWLASSRVEESSRAGQGRASGEGEPS